MGASEVSVGHRSGPLGMIRVLMWVGTKALVLVYFVEGLAVLPNSCCPRLGELQIVQTLQPSEPRAFQREDQTLVTG